MSFFGFNPFENINKRVMDCVGDKAEVYCIVYITSVIMFAEGTRSMSEKHCRLFWVNVYLKIVI